MNNLLNQAVTIQRATYSKDSSGGTVETLSSVYTAVPANIQPTKADIVLAYQQRQQKVETTIYTNQALTVQNGDYVLWGSVRFKIIGVRNLINFNRVLAIDCVQLLGAT